MAAWRWRITASRWRSLNGGKTTQKVTEKYSIKTMTVNVVACVWVRALAGGRRHHLAPSKALTTKHEAQTKKKWNSCTAHKKNVFVTLYPAADDEFERFDSCRTGIRDGRLCVDVRSGKTLSRELEVIEEEDFLFVFFCALAGSWPFPKNNELRPSMTQDVD